MSNHSSHIDPEMSGLTEEQLRRIREVSQKLGFGLGPTGQFPQGQLTAQDEGEIRIAITHTQGKVVIDFGSQVTWIGFTPEQAEQIAYSLLEKATKAKKES